MSGLKVVFWKELADNLGSRKFLILFIIICLTAISIVYTLSQNIGEYVDELSTDYMFLNLFSSSAGNLPSFIFFVSFFGPIIGIVFGFDAINGERSQGTISTVLSQPIYRDTFINGKFLAGLSTIALMLISIIMIILGLQLRIFGIISSLEELLRMIIFFIASVVYIGFWMSMAILFSIIFRQTTTSILLSLMIWIFFAFFILMISSVIANQIAPIDPQNYTLEMLIKNDSIKSLIEHVSPVVLIQEISTVILNPLVRTFDISSLIQANSLIPSPLPLSLSLLVIWPQFIGLTALMVICFATSYIIFMRQEIRST